MKYTHSFLEDYIEELYKSIGVWTPKQLDIETISNRLGITVMFIRRSPMQSGKTIVLDSRSTDAQRWQDFCHELCHVLWHGVNQRVMNKLYLDYQEWKADSFSLHACIPTFMLLAMDLPRSKNEAVGIICDVFSVEPKFAEQRLDIWLQQRKGHLFHQKITRELSK